MIINLDHFLHEERPYWHELEAFLARFDENEGSSLTLTEAKRFHYLYQRASGDLARLMTFSTEEDVRRYVENLVSRAYCEIHELPERPHRLTPIHWLLFTFPRTFRRHLGAFWLSLIITVAGCLFGAGAIYFDPPAKQFILPFEHLMGDPSERVRREEQADETSLAYMREQQFQFSASLMQNNIKVSLMALSLGMSWGFGTIIVLFYNGVILGAVALDYIRAGEIVFLLGWLLPHGVIEIPAILVGGQAGLVLARALIGRGQAEVLGLRLRRIGPDLVTLAGGLSVMLIWAGIIEAFLSQAHQPVIPYAVKITFGVVELIALIAFLGWSGKAPDDPLREPAI